MVSAVRNPYGPLNPLKTEYVAAVIREVNYRMELVEVLFDAELELLGRSEEDRKRGLDGPQAKYIGDSWNRADLKEFANSHSPVL